MGTWNHGGVTALAVRCPSCELKGEVQGISGSRVPSAPSAHKPKKGRMVFWDGSASLGKVSFGRRIREDPSAFSESLRIQGGVI